jgi:hypothetical protein
MMIFNVITLVLLSLSVVLPRASDSENFGAGTMRSKLIILGTAVNFGTFIAGFRTGVIWSAPHPVSSPPWYDTKAAFYVLRVYLCLRDHHHLSAPHHAIRQGILGAKWQ